MEAFGSQEEEQRGVLSEKKGGSGCCLRVQWGREILCGELFLRMWQNQEGRGFLSHPLCFEGLRFRSSSTSSPFSQELLQYVQQEPTHDYSRNKQRLCGGLGTAVGLISSPILDLLYVLFRFFLDSYWQGKPCTWEAMNIFKIYF